ncbi:MAG: polyamine aminopropyltransferase, partial [Chlamydiota bacterium]
MKMDPVLYREQTSEQDLVIFENPRLGRVLALDGIIQLTEADEHVYHEMIVHVPLLTHGQAEKVLIIGGGDGGALREVLRHGQVQKVVLVEIDPTVIAMCREMFPMVSRGSFDDPRAEIVIADGTEYVRTAEERFDVIICDSTDPVGPGKVLFT